MKIINSLDECIHLLKNNALITYPTETFYALGCVLFENDDNKNAKENKALTKIFQAKQRDFAKPLPLIVKNYEQVLEITDINKEIEEYLQEICSSFWADSLSICLKASKKVPNIVTANTGKIVVRQSPHKVVQNLLDKLNSPLISTSANISGQKAVQYSKDISEKLNIAVILDTCKEEDIPKGGLASTIIELLANKEIKILRKGAFNTQKIANLGYTIKD